MKKVAVILAHPDDAEIWVGGTILNHVNNGDKVLILYLFLDNEERKREAELINKISNIRVNTVESQHMIRPMINDFKPDIIITHWEKDFHFEHQKTYDMVAKLVPYLILEDGLRFNLYLCDTYNSIGKCNEVFTPNIYVDISRVWLNKIKLIMNHKSQPVNYWVSMIKTQNRLYGARILSDYAEGFIQQNALGHIQGCGNVLK